MAEYIGLAAIARRLKSGAQECADRRVIEGVPHTCVREKTHVESSRPAERVHRCRHGQSWVDLRLPYKDGRDA